MSDETKRREPWWEALDLPERGAGGGKEYACLFDAYDALARECEDLRQHRDQLQREQDIAIVERDRLRERVAKLEKTLSDMEKYGG